MLHANDLISIKEVTQGKGRTDVSLSLLLLLLLLFSLLYCEKLNSDHINVSQKNIKTSLIFKTFNDDDNDNDV